MKTFQQIDLCFFFLSTLILLVASQVDYDDLYSELIAIGVRLQAPREDDGNFDSLVDLIYGCIGRKDFNWKPAFNKECEENKVKCKPLPEETCAYREEGGKKVFYCQKLPDCCKPWPPTSEHQQRGCSTTTPTTTTNTTTPTILPTTAAYQDDDTTHLIYDCAGISSDEDVNWGPLSRAECESENQFLKCKPLPEETCAERLEGGKFVAYCQKLPDCCKPWPATSEHQRQGCPTTTVTTAPTTYNFPFDFLLNYTYNDDNTNYTDY